jgi:hypothetical protein
VKYADIGVNMGGGAFALETGAGGGGVDKYVGTEDTENDEPPPLGVEPIGFPDGPFGTGTSVNTPFGTSGASTKCTTPFPACKSLSTTIEGNKPLPLIAAEARASDGDAKETTCSRWAVSSAVSLFVTNRFVSASNRANAPTRSRKIPLSTSPGVVPSTLSRAVLSPLDA